jgi:hypothetical protein
MITKNLNMSQLPSLEDTPAIITISLLQAIFDINKYNQPAIDGWFLT